MSVATIDVSGASWPDDTKGLRRRSALRRRRRRKERTATRGTTTVPSMDMPGATWPMASQDSTAGNGGDGGSISFEIGVLNGAVVFTAAGGRGGPGGEGGEGGDGAKGGRGGNGNDCEFGLVGGNGGHGGAGGGGPAGGAVLAVVEATVAVFSCGFALTTRRTLNP